MTPLCPFCLLPVTVSPETPAAVRETPTGVEVAHLTCLPASEPRWKRGTKAQALVSAYRDLPAEHRDTATYSTVDEDGTYRVFVLTIGRVEWFAQQYWERVAIHSVSPLD